MKMRNTFVTHTEKVSYLTNYLKSSSTKPLMIVGKSRNGKTAAINDASVSTSVNICIYMNKNMKFIHNPKSDVLKTIIESLGSNEDYTFAGYLGATIIQFVNDPAFE